MEITEQEFEQMQSKIAEQKREIEQLRSKDIDSQIKEHLQFRKQQAKEIAERCEQVRQSFK
jgi:hypothetical protein